MKNKMVFELQETQNNGNVLMTFFDEDYAKAIAAKIRSNGIAVHVHQRYRPIDYLVSHIDEILFDKAIGMLLEE